MLPTLVEIKEKLVKALDDKKDVDDAAIVEMVSILEKYPITRTTLEETKIGKMVNDLRRKIKNDKLAKRIKQLIRNWRKLLDETGPVNGSLLAPAHPAISQLRSSPAVSPALSRISSSGSLVSPAQGFSGIPKLPHQKNASPVLSGPRSSVGGRKGLSPVPGANGLATSAAYRVASPALPGGRPKMSAAGRLASPALAAHGTSPMLADRVVSPYVSGRRESPVMSGREASPTVSDRVASPAAFASVGRGSPLLAQSPVQSPSLQSDTPRSASLNRRDKASANIHRLRKVASSNEISNSEEKSNALTFHSEHSLDWLDGEMNKNRCDSDGEASCSSSKASHSKHAFPHNHSTKLSVTNSNNKNCVKDQRELSKTNMANRKRTREKSDSPEENSNKKSRLEIESSLSAHSHKQNKLVNGYTPKTSKRQSIGFDSSSLTSRSIHKQVSSPLMSRTLSEDGLFHPHLQSNQFLVHQESTESFLSTQSFDRPSRDKHKVKTTEQLIEELQKKNNGSKVGNNIMDKLRTHQIEQEEDVPGSALPAGMKPKGKRGRPRKNDIVSVPPSKVKMSQVKSDIIERFLKTSEPSSHVEDSPFKDDLLPDPVHSSSESRLGVGAFCNEYSQPTSNSVSGPRLDSKEVKGKEKSRLTVVPPVPSTSQTERTGSALTLQELYAQLPPVDYDIDWDAVDFFELPERVPVTDETVQELHTEQLPGINGLFDISGSWSTWQQPLTLPSYEDEPLHILPYVDLDN